jgi:septal ring factor EnvC (AmiA/AmiB activator)
MSCTDRLSKPRFSSSFWVCCLIWLSCSLAPPIQAQSSTAQSSDQDYQRSLGKLKKELHQLTRSLNQAKDQRGALSKTLQKTEEAIGTLNRQLKDTAKQKSAQEKQLRQLNKQRLGLNRSAKQQEQQIAKQMRAAYKLGQQGNIKLLLNQESPSEVARMLRYYDYFLAARGEKIDDYRTTLNQLDTLEPKILAETLALQNSQKVLQQDKQKLSDQQSTRQATLATLDATISDRGSRLQALQTDQKHLQTVLQKMAEALAAIPVNNSKVKQRRGNLNLPTPGKIAKAFGAPRAEGKMRWEGLLISAQAGSQVTAIHHGQVVFSDYLKSYGLLLIIDHGDGYMSLYAHNQSLLRDTGDWVEAGETVSTVGSSGGKNKAGLYFELRHRGKPINPVPWFGRG